jgi:hypothetical protein
MTEIERNLKKRERNGKEKEDGREVAYRISSQDELVHVSSVD